MTTMAQNNPDRAKMYWKISELPVYHICISPDSKMTYLYPLSIICTVNGFTFQSAATNGWNETKIDSAL